MDRVVKTVKVTIHLSPTGTIALGIIESEWHGSTRLDRRLARARPCTHRLADAPRGVTPAVWLALKALEDLVDEQEAQARSTDH